MAYVYIVCRVYDYEGESIDSVFDTKAKAETRAAEIERCRKLPLSHPENIYWDGAEVYAEEVR
ncbi:TPA: hypothetical protein NO423_004094 [Salmonella enterica subsp. enterica serovar Infantis]|nr:hypothetical protein [Salmonella enterica subsp. enterica serovar Infantis]HCI4149830.1 hypothetical protein [Salmonella enterica subsp. enterica serovar Infantis]